MRLTALLASQLAGTTPALAPPGSAALRQTLARVQRAYPTTYAKRTAVWFGCLH